MEAGALAMEWMSGVNVLALVHVEEFESAESTGKDDVVPW